MPLVYGVGGFPPLTHTSITVHAAPALPLTRGRPDLAADDVLRLTAESRGCVGLASAVGVDLPCHDLLGRSPAKLME